MKRKAPRKVKTAREMLRSAVKMYYRFSELGIAMETAGKAIPRELGLSGRWEEWGKQTGKIASQIREKAILVLLERDWPIWTDWLSGVRGVGPVLGGLIVSSFDPYKAPRISSFWKYAGLGVRPDGKCDYLERGKAAPYDPFVKTKVLFVLGSSFLENGNSEYGRVFEDEMYRLEHGFFPCKVCYGSGEAPLMRECEECGGTGQERPGRKCQKCHGRGELREGKEMSICWNCLGSGKGPWGKNPVHRRRAAMRKMVKHFLADLWLIWREMEGLPVTAPYSEARLGHVHHSG